MLLGLSVIHGVRIYYWMSQWRCNGGWLTLPTPHPPLAPSHMQLEENFLKMYNMWLPWKSPYCFCQRYYFIIIIPPFLFLPRFLCSLSRNLTPWTYLKTQLFAHHSGPAKHLFWYVFCSWEIKNGATAPPAI